MKQRKRKQYGRGVVINGNMACPARSYIISYKRDPVSINVLSNAEVEYESHK